MIQGTEEWLEWRRKGIGGSDIAAILGICKYATPYQIWLEKTNRAGARKGNWASDRGKEFEDVVRKRYELASMRDMIPSTIVHPKYEIVRASLDGFCETDRWALEIKVPSAESHQMAINGLVPEHYRPQTQWNLAASGADGLDYFSYHEKDGVISDALVEVLPDIKYQGELIVLATDFWNRYVLTDIAPPLTDRDVKEIIGHPEIAHICQTIKIKKETLSKSELDSLKAKAVSLAQHPKMKCEGVQISTVLRKGVFSYHKLTINEVG